MFIVSLDEDRLDEVYSAEPAGIVEHAGYFEVFFHDRETAERFGEPIECPEVDWEQHNYDAWPPLLVGEKFFVVAPWRDDPTPPGRFRLEINPGMQCGTGQHPCTQLCLEEMERLIQPGDSVLDVGTGSGILSIAAKLLGAGRVIACDIDPEAAREAPFFIGSVDAVKSNSFDVVVANINESVIEDLHPEFVRVARRRILSGVRDDNGQWTCVVEPRQNSPGR
jgi:ribosomal protein L11 methyltransferase